MIDLIRLRAVARKEALQLRRDRRSLVLAFVLPLLLLVFFGYAISFDVRHLALGVIDQDRSAASRALLETFEASGYFEIVARLEDPAEVERLFARRVVQIVLVIPPSWQAKLGGAAAAPVQVLLDGSDANTASIALGYAQAVARSAAAQGGVGPGAPRLEVASRVLYNESLSSRNMIVPGLIAVIMMIIAAMLTSLTIAREWERGTMEQLAATPVGRLEVVVGKLLPYLGIGLIDTVVCSALGVWLFEVPFRGKIWLLGGLSLLFLSGALGLGLFISAATRSQMLSTQVSMLATFLPGFLLSGFMFPIENMPLPMQAITYLLPARYFLEVTRGIFLKGVGLEVLGAQAGLMVLFAVVGLLLAAKSFRKELE